MIDMPDYVVCELHEVGNCTICTGADKAALLAEKTREEELLAKTGYMRAAFGGRCARCGHYFPTGSVIRYSKANQGWVSMSCCEW